MQLLRLLLLLVATLCPRPTLAQSSEEAVRAVIDAWYSELRKGRSGRYDNFLAPGGIVIPTHPCVDRDKPQPRGLTGREPLFPHLLVRRAQRFAHTVERANIEPSLARVDVWERGWIYAWAAKQTYENAAAATFVLERREGAGWKIVLYASHSQAVRPQHRGEPMPDLSPDATAPGAPR